MQIRTLAFILVLLFCECGSIQRPTRTYDALHTGRSAQCPCIVGPMTADHILRRCPAFMMLFALHTLVNIYVIRGQWQQTTFFGDVRHNDGIRVNDSRPHPSEMLDLTMMLFALTSLVSIFVTQDQWPQTMHILQRCPTKSCSVRVEQTVWLVSLNTGSMTADRILRVEHTVWSVSL